MTGPWRSWSGCRRCVEGNAGLSSGGSDLLELHSYRTRKDRKGIELFEFWVLVNLSLASFQNLQF